MSSLPSSGSGPSWRSTEDGLEASSAGPAWTRARGRNPLGQQRWRWPAIILLALALPIALGSLIWMVQRLRLPTPAHLELVCAGYELNVQIPHNVPAKKALKRLFRLAGGKGGQWFEKLARYHPGSGGLADLDIQASAAWKAEGNGPSKKALELAKLRSPTVIVIMALHGGVDDSGAYFLLQDSKATPDPGNRLRLTDVIETLASLPASQNKVLILDATRLEYHFELGMIDNGFVEQLERLEQRILQIPRLVVISASGVNEKSWVDRSNDECVFLRALINRMIVPRSKGGRLSLGRLVEAVSQDVEDWVWTHREALQRPVLLPRGEEGKSRAMEIELPVLLTDSLEDSAPVDARRVGAELQSIWREYHHVEGPEDPPYMPYITSPGFWRLYQANVTRFDELARAGDMDSAGELTQRLQLLETEMRAVQVRKLGSALGTLAMPILTGEMDPFRAFDRRIPERFDKLWKLSDAEQPGEWIRWKAESARYQPVPPDSQADTKPATAVVGIDSGRSHPQWLTAQVGGLILDRAIADPKGNLSQAARLARILDSPLEIRPQELHFLIMLDRDLPRPTLKNHAPIVALALKVRRLAERAMMGLEEEGRERADTVAIPEVSALVREAVSLGDEQRQRGQDLLFAADEASLQEAGTAQKEAESWYRDAVSEGAKMRAALSLRDHVFADLPAYTQWLLHFRFPRGRPQYLVGFRNHLVDLWRKAHRLNEALSHVDLAEVSRPNSSSAFTDLSRQIEHLNQLTTELNQALFVIKTDLTAYVSAILSSPGKKGLAEEYANLLALTVLEDQDRETLERAYWGARDGDKAGSNQQPSRSEIFDNEQQSVARVLTRNRGLIALEILGDHELSHDCNGPETTTGFEDRPAVSADRYYQLKEYLQSLDEDKVKPETSREREVDLVQFGQEIGARLDCLLQRLNMQSRLLSEPIKTNPAQPAGRSVRLADDELIRRIGPVAMFNVDLKVLAADPVPVHRLALFLESQARRAGEDRWYGEESRERVGQASPPYHERVARAFLGDVKGLGLLGDGETTTTSHPGDLRLIGPDRLTMTSEPKIDVSYRLEADDDPVLQRGIAAVWIDHDPFHQSQARSVDAVSPRAMPLARGKSKDLTHSVAAPPGQEWSPSRPRLAPRLEKLGARALFRGRILAKTTDIVFTPVPDLRIVQVPATSSGIIVTSSVEANGVSNPDGAVAIVLDASGSMAGLGTQPGKSKYVEAVEALQRVLSRLPERTRVSVWVFGQAMGDGLTVEAERAIQCVLPPVPWRADLRTGLINQLSSFRLWNKSAVVRVMLQAAQDLEGVEGYRALVVLTDGEDNRWLLDAEANTQQLDVAAALRARFDQSGIAVHVIAYRVNDSLQRDRTQAQFQVVTQLKTPGSFLLADDAGMLADRLERSMPRGINYRVLQSDNRLVPNMPPTGIPVGRPGTLDRPLRLPPGGYQLWLQGQDHPGSEFVVDSGRWLLLKVVPGSGTSNLKAIRGLYSSELFPFRPSRRDSRSEWTLAALQNGAASGGGLQMVVALERTFDRKEAILQSICPREVWIELAPESGERRGITTRLVALPGYPASTWSADALDWPIDAVSKLPAAPVLEAWWDPDRLATPEAALKSGRDFQALDDLRGRKIEVAGGRVIMESVSMEIQTVMIDSERSEQQPCLVVRVAHPPELPVRVRLDAAGIAGSEERFYQEAGKTMTLFWPMTSDQAPAAIHRLELLSLNGFKREAEQRGFHVRLDRLGQPLAGDPRPPSALAGGVQRNSPPEDAPAVAPLPSRPEGR